MADYFNLFTLKMKREKSVSYGNDLFAKLNSANLFAKAQGDFRKQQIEQNQSKTYTCDFIFVIGIKN